MDTSQDYGKALDWLLTPCSQLGSDPGSFLDLEHYDPSADPDLQSMLASMPMKTSDIGGVGVLPDVLETTNDNHSWGPLNVNAWQTLSTVTSSHRTRPGSCEHRSGTCLIWASCPLTSSTAIQRLTCSTADVLDRFFSNSHAQGSIGNDLARTIRICIGELKISPDISSSARRQGQMRSEAEARGAIEGTWCVDQHSVVLMSITKRSVPDHSGKSECRKCVLSPPNGETERRPQGSYLSAKGNAAANVRSCNDGGVVARSRSRQCARRDSRRHGQGLFTGTEREIEGNRSGPLSCRCIACTSAKQREAHEP